MRHPRPKGSAPAPLSRPCTISFWTHVPERHGRKQLYLIAATVALVALLAAAVPLLMKAASPGVAGAWEVTVTAESVLAEDRQPPVILATVSNPGPVPVLVGLRVRQRLWPAGGGSRTTARVPWRPTRRRYRADRQTTVGVVRSGGSTSLSVPVPGIAGGSFSLVAVVGHYDRRLRVISVPVTVPRPRWEGEAGIVIISPTGWP